MRRLAIAAATLAAATLLTPAPVRSITFATLPVTTAADTASPPSPLSFLSRVHLCPVRDCASGGPICPTDSIEVQLAGTFPNGCYRVVSIEPWVPPNVPIREAPPWVKVLVRDNGPCAGPCFDHLPANWSGVIRLHPLSAGPYGLVVAVAVETCSDSIPPDPWDHASFPFEVAASCDTTSPPSNCLIGEWLHSHIPATSCDATFGPDSTAHVTFMVRTGVPLAGLQGTFQIGSVTPVAAGDTSGIPVGTGLYVSALTPIGPAASMHLTWTRQPYSIAKFVLLADQGAPIASDVTGSPVPILDVTVSSASIHRRDGTVDPGLPPPPAAFVAAANLLGSDVDGRGIHECLLPRPSDVARLCSGPTCDFNRDGATDIRDLVLMIHCFQSQGRCTNTFDCNQDGSFTLDDVLCCAWRVLQHPPCAGPDCPPDSGAVRRDDQVRVSVGVAVATTDGVTVPVHIDGADRLGAARLTLPFPSDRYRVVGFDSNASAWLPLAGTQGSAAVMGLIRIAGVEVHAPPSLDLSLRLAPLGTATGGDLGPLDGEFSGTDGVKLQVQVNGPARPLPGGPGFELSANRPEPFHGVTHFTLSLPRAASVDVSVYDVNGRRVATLHRGALAAGVTELAWDGRADGGARLGSGIYFYRARATGWTATRRMVLLGTP